MLNSCPCSALSLRRMILTAKRVSLLCSVSFVLLTACGAKPALHLFTNWYGVEAGTTLFRVNRQNVDPESREIIEQVKDYYKIEMVDGNFAPERISVPTGVRIRAEVATKSEPWLKPEKPWEEGGVALQRVIHDGGRYRVWYSASVRGRDKVIKSPINGRPKLGSDGETFSGLCYMESTDAVHWTKPSLGLVEFRGSKDNNIVTTDPRVGVAIFLDPSAPPSERYKTVTSVNKTVFDPNSKIRGPVLAGAVSPDGIHWNPLPEPLWDDIFNNDGSPEVHLDPLTKKYVLYMRANYPRRRSISRADTSDFRRWPYPVIILTPGPDDDPSVDFYNNSYFFYPGSDSTHLMLVSAYHRDTSQVDVRLASSMDGDGWNWLDPKPVIPLGGAGSWDGGMIYAFSDMVRLPDGRVAVGFIGNGTRHEEYWRTKFEKGYQNKREQLGAWAIWEDGRIAGIEAVKKGEFTTLPLKATGSPIEINARTGVSGSVQVDVLIDEPGRPLPRLVLQAREMTGDLLWKRLEFPKGSLAEVAGRNIRLRFHMYDAKVFGVRGDGLEWERTPRRSPAQL